MKYLDPILLFHSLALQPKRHGGLLKTSFDGSPSIILDNDG
ncbi:hypothetical protein [Desulfosporosinus sp.]|nr:hypothetical protein [Desulfosporosinus sp.]